MWVNISFRFANKNTKKNGRPEKKMAKKCLGVEKKHVLVWCRAPPTQNQVICLFTGLLDNHDRADSPQVLSTSKFT
jgi:hypothetical protein